MLLEVENTTNQRVERGSFVFKPGEVRVVELDPAKGNYKELDAATSLRVVDLGAAEMAPLSDTGESFEDRAARLESEFDSAKEEYKRKRNALVDALNEVKAAEQDDETARKNAALAGEDVSALQPTAPAARGKANSLRYEAWAAEIKRYEAERDFHLSTIPVFAARDKAADDRVKQAESAKADADLELHNAKIAAGRIGYEANREDNLARSAAGKIARLKREGGQG